MDHIFLSPLNHCSFSENYGRFLVCHNIASQSIYKVQKHLKFMIQLGKFIYLRFLGKGYCRSFEEKNLKM